MPVDIARGDRRRRRWRLWLTDSHGTVVATGARTTDPAPRWLASSEPVSPIAACRAAAARPQTSTTPPPTPPEPPPHANNLGPLCRRHHNQNPPRMGPDQQPDGTYTWTTPPESLHRQRPSTAATLTRQPRYCETYPARCSPSAFLATPPARTVSLKDHAAAIAPAPGPRSMIQSA